MKPKIIFTCVFLFLCSYSFGQVNEYGYKRELTGIKDPWHKIILPDEIFAKLSPDLSDIRIFGFTEKHDTIEAPYILKIATEKKTEKNVVSKLINRSKNEKGYYFTFEVPTENTINKILLDFKEKNFDWRVNLEGSHDQKEWFSIIDGYRILSIKNELTDFQFTKLIFTDSRYRYYRLLINSEKKPELITAKISMNENTGGSFKKYNNSAKIAEDRPAKQTIINIGLSSPVPVSYIKIFFQNKIDYYRPVTINYVMDSFKTDNGWNYNYGTLSSGTLNSIEKNEFLFNSIVLKKMQIIIENRDNVPLKIDSLVVQGYVHELIARFIEPAMYFLTYDNQLAAKPNYDIAQFADNIPTTLSALKIGNEVLLLQEPKREPLFKNKAWLWVVMIIIILLLGWFSMRMMKSEIKT